jgi:hypothetical protein
MTPNRPRSTEWYQDALLKMFNGSRSCKPFTKFQRTTSILDRKFTIYGDPNEEDVDPLFFKAYDDPDNKGILLNQAVL